MSHLATERIPPPDYMTLDLAHYSLEHSDTPKQKAHDVELMFSKGYDGITGTEAGQGDMIRLLRVMSHEAGYALTIYKSNFVCIQKKLIIKGTKRKHAETFVDNDLTKGRGFDLNVVGMTVDTPRLGTWSLLASHYATKGRPTGGELGQNRRWNRELARGIGGLADELGVGKALSFYGGDQNIPDREYDTFFGEDLTSAWDELGKYENTGHGNIDVIASHDKDGRVEAKYIRALDDREQFMHGDHFPVEAGFRVKLLAS